ncbi:MAG: PEP-CTERM sorting domain-containing protein [Fimbriimonadaceae bacterium]|nr:PEP-CTERM sorting domain-containing protein [Fimbriimonadaceae bacterium]QYK59334.1 MAG: PEP-CTERM sorting domain-containing protein [Fimbriimonadaceae bacterium]
MNRILSLAFGLCLAAVGSAQSINSFLVVEEIQGIDVQVANSGLDHTVSVLSAPKFKYQGNWYDIKDVFGYWSLSVDDDLTVVNQNQGVWTANNNNASTGGIAGWRTNPNTGLTANTSFMFQYDALSFDKVEGAGYHVRLSSGNFPGTTGDTGYITTVPEPATMLALGTGLAALAARRRKNKSC